MYTYTYVYVGIFSVLSISGRLISCFIVLSYFRPEIDIYVVLVHVQYHTSGSTGTSVLPGARAYTFVRVFCHEYVFRWLFFELRRGLQYTYVLYKYENRIPFKVIVLHVIRKNKAKKHTVLYVYS